MSTSFGDLAALYVGIFFVGIFATLCSLLRARDSRRNLLFALVLTLLGWLGLAFAGMFNWKVSLMAAVVGTKLGSQAYRDNFYEVLGLKQSRGALAVNRLMMTIGYVLGPLATVSAYTVSCELAAGLFTGVCLLVMMIVVTQWNYLLPNLDILTQDPTAERTQKHPFHLHQLASQELLKVPLLSPEDAPDFSVRGAKYRPGRLNTYAKLD
mmetsp:Transcript_3517/g.7308  ORF Transcript_3517/g.7308 Transcript_3517/m.7308 type:complete len:210 (-) Transcript_3517:2258-2887(-)